MPMQHVDPNARFQEDPAQMPPQGGDLLAPWTGALKLPGYVSEGFAAPTAVTMENDPGYQFRIKEAQDEIKRMAAMNGSFYTGNMIDALNKRTQDVASSEFGNVYDRALGSYNANANERLNAWRANYQQAMDEYNNRRADFYSNQDRPFDKLMQYSRLGLDAAGGLNNALNAYGSDYTNLYSALGNARSAGAIGQGNIYGGAATNLGNIGQDAWSLYKYGGRN